MCLWLRAAGWMDGFVPCTGGVTGWPCYCLASLDVSPDSPDRVLSSASGPGYELAPLPSWGYRIGPRAWEAHCFGT